MAIEINDLTPEGKRYMRELRLLEKLIVYVGYQESSGSYEDGASLVEVAAYNNLGSSDTPARPFMKTAFENHQDELLAICKDALKVIANGGTAQQALSRMGVSTKGLIQQEIVEGSFAPNAESTIAKKGSSKPLIDTGYMRENVTYVIRGGK